MKESKRSYMHFARREETQGKDKNLEGNLGIPIGIPLERVMGFPLFDNLEFSN